MDNVGIRIKNLREESAITQQELANFVCCSGQVISNIERGYTKPSPDVLAKIAEFFNVPADYLFGQTDARWIADSPYSRSNKFPTRVCNRMEHLQMTSSDLANAANIKQDVCEDIISGKIKPGVDSLSRIAASLHTTIDYLIGSSDYAIAVSNEDEEDVLNYFRNMDKSHRRRFMGMLEEMILK